MGPHDLSIIQDLACAAGILSIASQNAPARRVPHAKEKPGLLLIDSKTGRHFRIDSSQDMIRRTYRRIMEQLPR